MVSLVSSVASQPNPVTDALRSASQQTGVSFDYLLRTAEKESSLDPKAKAPTSSASGLFQFIEQTWLAIVKDKGAQFGFAREANAIERNPDGRLSVADGDHKRRILALRNDPSASAVFGAAFTQRNVDQLTRDLGRAPDAGEAYLAHVLGASGATRFLSLAQKNPDAPAARSFADAAAANRSIFFRPDGQARSFSDVQGQLTKRHSDAPNPIIAVQEAAQPALRQGAGRQDNQNVLVSLFREEGRGAVSSLVQSLWGNGAGQNSGALGFVQPISRPGFFPSIALKAGVPAEPSTVSSTTVQLARDVSAFSPAATPDAPIPIPLPRPRAGSPVNLPTNLLQFLRQAG